MTATLCGQFATRLRALTTGGLPEHALHAARRALLDALGSALAGAGTPEVEAAIGAARAWRAQGDVSVWGTALRFNGPHAALVNGTAVHAREVDDFGGCGHSGAVVVPAALAAAELRGDVTGADILAAVLAGYEAAARVINLCGGYPPHNALGWHGTGTCGVFGAAAAAARVLGLDDDKTLHAIALAGTYTGGIWSFIADGAMSKRLHAGKAAEGGLVAALLAQQGMTGPTHLFEPDSWGSFTSLYAGPHADPAALLNDYGNPFLIYQSGFKPYACCRACHSPLDAVLQLRAQHGFAATDIDTITIHAPEQTVRQVGRQDVHNILDAQMSLPYSVAVALRFGRADLGHYQPPHLGDAELAAFARRVTLIAEPGRKTGSEPEVRVHLAGGRTVAATVLQARGEHANPMSDDELHQKFLALATLRVDHDCASAIAETVWGLERLASVEPLVALLQSAPETLRRHDAVHPAPAG